MKSNPICFLLLIVGAVLPGHIAFGQMEHTDASIFPLPNAADVYASIDQAKRANKSIPAASNPDDPSHGVTSFDPLLAEQLQEVLNKSRNAQRVIGVSAAASVPGQGIWVGTAGLSDTTNSDSIRSDMTFGIGSITKTFIAALILKLAEEGRLSLDDPLRRWLPGYEHVEGSVTIRQLLGHTSGINDFLNTSNYWFFRALIEPNRLWSPNEILTTFLGPPDFPVGIRWGYSNTNYILLGMIIEKITQSTLSTDLRRRFWEPLGMNSTFLPPQDKITVRRPHHWADFEGSGRFIDFYDFPINALYSIAGAAGAMFSTPEDLVKWANALYGGSLLKEASLIDMVTVLPPSRSYGLGTVIIDVLGRQLWGHDGLYVAHTAVLIYSPQDKVSIAVCINQNPSNPYNIILALFNTIVNSQATSVVDRTVSLPRAFQLRQNYPNPFNPATAIDYYLTKDSSVTLRIYNIQGRVVRTLVDAKQSPGEKTVRWDGKNDSGKVVSSGVYLYNLQAEGYSESRKMLFVQ